MRVVLVLWIAAVAAVGIRANSSVEFTAPNGRHGRVENVGGGVWRVRLAEADGTFSDRGAVQGLAKFMDEPVPQFGAADGSRVEVAQSPFSVRFFSLSGRLVRELAVLEAEQGIPAVRPLVPDWQDDPNTYSISDEFMLGDAVLVALLFLNTDTSDFVALFNVLKGKS